MSLVNKYIERIKEEEGFISISFWDDAPGGGGGQWTWGYGTCAPGPGCTINEPVALKEVERKVEQHIGDFNEIFYNCVIPEDKSLVLLDMLYNLGRTRFSNFKNLIKAVHKANWKEAGKQVRLSLYYTQVTNRAEENARILEGGASV